MDVDSALTAAMRRRQRRLRQFLRHERLSVALALAEKLHHTSRGVRGLRGRSTTRYDDRSPLLPSQSSSVSKASPAGAGQHLCLRSLAGRNVWSGTPWSTGSRACPFVQILDAPVPQVGDQVVELLQKIVTASLMEFVQVIAVPKLSLDRSPQRSAVRRTQKAVEVPTELGYALAVFASKFLFEA